MKDFTKEQQDALWQIGEERSIERMKDGKRFSCHEIMVKEEAYGLVINGKGQMELYCTPWNLAELAAGYALSKSIISHKDDIKSIYIQEETREIFMETEKKENYQKPQAEERVLQAREFTVISPECVFQLWEMFDKACANFRSTGGLHSVALCSGQEVLLIHEDVSRYNALLKVLGAALLEDIPLRDKSMFFSGRIATQMVELLAKTGVSILLCHGAATLGAMDAAAKSDITLVGFIRKEYMNIYTGGHRIEGGVQ